MMMQVERERILANKRYLLNQGYLPGKGYLLGVDGGGTKTLALLAGPDGEIIGMGDGGPSNFYAVGFDAARASLETALRAAWDDAGLQPKPLAAACLGLAGAGRADDIAQVLAWVRGFISAGAIELVNDARLVIEAEAAPGDSPAWGLAIISGTGSIAYGWDPAGNTARSGGWGYLLGDEGSAFSVGLAALRAVCRAHDGRAPATLLTRYLLEAWSLNDPQELVGRVYQGKFPRTEISRLSRVVEAAADAGDAVAAAIFEQAGEELALAAASVASQLGLAGPIPCALAGGNLVFGQRTADAFLRSAETSGLTLDPVVRVKTPALGALRIAARIASKTR